MLDPSNEYFTFLLKTKHTNALQLHVVTTKGYSKGQFCFHSKNTSSSNAGVFSINSP